MSTSPTASLAPALSSTILCSAQHIEAVWSGKSLTECLAATPDDQRAAAQAVSFFVLRRLGLANKLRQLMVPKQPPVRVVEALLCVAIALLDAALQAEANTHVAADAQENDNTANTAVTRGSVPLYAVHTIVDQAVEAAQSEFELRPYKALINGTLRRFLRDHQALRAQALLSTEAQWNFPNWWVRRVRKAYPQQWESILRDSNLPGPLTLRVNQRRCTVQQLLQAFNEAGIQAWSPGQHAVVLAQAQPITSLPGYAEGWWSVQDYAAQQAGYLLPVKDGMRVLDACAAPGGKTAHLLEQADISMLALDVDASRLARVEQNVQRLGLANPQLRIQVGDASRPQQWWDGEPFDAILADVPCTASGIVRRHPDIRWLRRDSDVQSTVGVQERITDALWRTLKPGGYMLYATCSIFPQEGAIQATAFAYRNQDAIREEAPGQLLPQALEVGQPCGDGFFYALFRKQL